MGFDLVMALLPYDYRVQKGNNNVKVRKIDALYCHLDHLSCTGVATAGLHLANDLFPYDYRVQKKETTILWQVEGEN